MDIHKNARLTPLGRERMVTMVLSGQTPKAVSEAVSVCPRTVSKWVDRYQAEGVAGLQDRSSRPQQLYRPTPQPVVDRIEALRRQRLTGKAIAAETGVSAATVSRRLDRDQRHLCSTKPSEVHSEVGFMEEQISVTLTRQDKYRFLVDFGVGVPQSVSDEPPRLGEGAGPSPTHLLAAAMANCLSASLLFSLGKFKDDPGAIKATAVCEFGRN